MGKPWEESLFGCFSNIPVCALVCMLPGGLCIVQASAVNDISNEGKMIPCLLVFCLLSIGGTINRETIRRHLELEGSILSSCVSWFFCPTCSVCQEYREVKSRTKHRH